MQTIPVERRIQWAFAAVCVVAITSSALAGSFTRGCAARDLQILKLIEERESANAISAQKLSEALKTMMNARVVCHEGYVMDALAIYDNVAKSIATEPVTVGQKQ